MVYTKSWDVTHLTNKKVEKKMKKNFLFEKKINCHKKSKRPQKNM